MRRLKHCHWLLVLVALMLCVSVVTGADTTVKVTPTPVVQVLQPGAILIVADGNMAWLVHAPIDGSVPVVVAVFQFGTNGPDPPVPPLPGKVAGVFILEEQSERTVQQGKVLNDPVWQTAALLKGLTYHIEDQDKPDLLPAVKAAAAESVLPVVCWINSDGEVIEVVPLPATVEEMRALIGGVK